MRATIIPLEDEMKSLTRYLTFNVDARMDFVHITPQVEELVQEPAARWVTSSLCISRLTRETKVMQFRRKALP